MTRFDGKVVVITGSGSGLGRETARIVASEGGRVIISDRIATRVAEAVADISGAGGIAEGMVADVTQQDDMDRLVAFAVERFGRIDAMYANAGIPEPNMELGVALHDASSSDWDAVVNVNGRGVFLSFRSAVRQMIEQRTPGVLLATTSASASFIYPGFGLYAASKAAANAIVKAFAVTHGPYGIRANAIAPFHGMSANFLMPPDAPVMGKSYEELSDWDPQGNSGAMPLALPTPPTIHDNASLAAFLLSDDARYISGEIIHSASGGTGARVAIDFGQAAAGDVLPTALRAELG